MQATKPGYFGNLNFQVIDEPQQEFAFDVTLKAALRVKAGTEADARMMLAKLLQCADSNLGAWPDGSPILAELSLSGTPELYEIDGDEPPAHMFPRKGEQEFAIGRAFRIYEDPARGYRVVRNRDGAEAIFQGDDSCEIFRDNFNGDEFAPEDPIEYAGEADEFGAWCEANGEI